MVSEMAKIFIPLVLSLVTAHLVADFVLRSKSIWRKNQAWLHLCVHGVIYGVLVYLIMGIWQLWLPAVILAIAHLLIDAILLTGMDRFYKRESMGYFLADQLLHLSMLLLVLFVFYLPQQSVPFWVRLFPTTGYQTLLVVSGVILLVPFSGELIAAALQPLQDQMHKRFKPNTLRPVEGLKEGGKIIGYLERLLIFVFILSGQFAGVGFLVAAKSIFRFGELKESENRKQAEYVIIGTFSSFLLAILISLAVQALLRFSAG